MKEDEIIAKLESEKVPITSWEEKKREKIQIITREKTILEKSREEKIEKERKKEVEWKEN